MAHKLRDETRPASKNGKTRPKFGLVAHPSMCTRGKFKASSQMKLIVQEFDETWRPLQITDEVRPIQKIATSLIVKLKGTQTFYPLLDDNEHVTTGGDISVDLGHLLMVYYVFWLDYPAELKYLFRLLEYVFDIKKLMVTPAFQKTLALLENA